MKFFHERLRLKALLFSALAFSMSQAACLDESAPPELSGPSELALSILVGVDPDQLTADGFSTSVVEAVVRNENGDRQPGVQIRFDIIDENSGVFADVGNLTQLNGARPVAGGVEAIAVSAVTDGQGVARARYWSPFRSDNANDGQVTIAAREASRNANNALFRTASIFLRAADRPIFPGGQACGFTREPLKLSYAPGEPVVFTATQIFASDACGSDSANGVFVDIGRYEWLLTDGTIEDEAFGRTFTATAPVAGTWTVSLVTTATGTGCQATCALSYTVQ